MRLCLEQEQCAAFVFIVRALVVICNRAISVCDSLFWSPRIVRGEKGKTSSEGRM